MTSRQAIVAAERRGQLEAPFYYDVDARIFNRTFGGTHNNVAVASLQRCRRRRQLFAFIALFCCAFYCVHRGEIRATKSG